MKKIKGLSTAGTVICIISASLYLLLALFFLFGVTDLFWGFTNDSMSNIGNVDSNSPSAGFEVIAYFAGGGLSFIGGLIAFVMAFLYFGLILYQIPAIISGLVANSRYKKNVEIPKCLNSYRTDGFIKVIMNGLVVALTVLFIIGNIDEAGLVDVFLFAILIWNYITVLVLGILQIKEVSKEANKENII